MYRLRDAPEDFRVFALPYVKRIVDRLRPTGVKVIYFANDGATLLRDAVLFCGRGLGLKDAAIVAHSPGAARRKT